MDEVSESEHSKEVYAYFGLAMHVSQILEYGFANATFAFSVVPNSKKMATPETWPDLADSFYEKEFEKTMGRLLGTFKKSGIELPENIDNLFQEALEKRNWLAHDYFKERAEEFMTESGRNLMIKGLEEAVALFDEANKELDKLVKPQYNKYGYTEELFRKEYEEMVKNLK